VARLASDVVASGAIGLLRPHALLGTLYQALNRLAPISYTGADFDKIGWLPE
jgi:hypothetical protein